MTQNDFLNRDFLEGIKEDEKPETETRGLGALIQDVGIKLAEPAVTAARTVTGGIRAYMDRPEGPEVDVDMWLGRQQKALREEGLSQRQQAIDTSKWFNRGPDDRSAWDVPVQALTSQALGLVLPAVGAAVTGGGTAVGGAIAGGAMGVLDSGEAINNTRDFIDQADQRELMKLEPYMKFYRNNGGNDKDARFQLFKESVDLIDVAANVGANVISFGVLGHAISRAGKNVESGMLKFLGRAAFGLGEGGAAGFAEGAAGEVTAQRAAVKQGRQQDIDIAKITSAGVEAIPGMAIPVGALHAVRRSPAEATVTEEKTERPGELDGDIKGVLSETIAPTPTASTAAAMVTGPPPGPPHPMFGGEQGAPQAQTHPMLSQPPDLAAAHPVFGPGEQFGPPAPPGAAPPPPSPPGPGMSGPQAGGVWGQAMPGVQANVPPPPPQYGPPAPPPTSMTRPRISDAPTGPPVGGGIWRGAQPEVQARMSPQYGPLTEPYGPPREQYGPPTEPYGPPRPPPTPPTVPRFDPTGRLGLPTPDEFGGEAAAEGVGRPVAARSIHVTPEDAKKIRDGYRLVPGAGNLYTLETKGGKSVGRISAHGAGEGLIEVGIDADGFVAGKGKSVRRATMDAGLRLGATEGVAPAPAPASPDTRQPATAAEGQAGAPVTMGAPPEEHIAQRNALRRYAAPLRPGRATWRRPGGDPIEVEILDREEHPSGMHWVRYDIPDKSGRRQQGEGWIDSDQLSQPGVINPGAGGGPAGPRGGGGPPGRGTFQEQLQAAAEQIFTPTGEDLSEETENIIRGGVAAAEPEDRIKWADKLQDALDRRGRLMEADFPKEMLNAKKHMDKFEWDTMVHAATRINPQEVIDVVREPPLGGGRNPVIRELAYRKEGRKSRLSAQEQGRSEAERGGFRKTVAVPEGEHLVVPWVEQPAEAEPALRGERAHISAREAEQQAQRNIEVQQAERQRRQRLKATPTEPEAPLPAGEERTQKAAAAIRVSKKLKSAGGGPSRAPGIDETNLRADIKAYNLRLDYFSRGVVEDTPVERERLARIHESLHARADQLDALRFRRGLPENDLKLSIKELPKAAPKPKSVQQEAAEQQPAAPAPAPTVEDVVAWASELVDQETYRKSRAPQPPMSREELEARVIPGAGWKGRFAISKAKLKALPKEKREAVEAAGKPLRLDIRKIWHELPEKTRQALMEQDRARALAEAKRTGMPERREISWAEYRAAVGRDYWKNLTPAKKKEYLDEAEKAANRRLTDTELREVVIREVEALHRAARKRAIAGLGPMPIRTGKISGKRQKELPRELPTEQEALDRLAEEQFKLKKQQSRERSGDIQYGQREEVIKETFLNAVTKRFGTEARFTDLITQIANLSIIRPPTRQARDQPTLFQKIRRMGEGGPGKGLTGFKLGDSTIQLITQKKDPESGEMIARDLEDPKRRAPKDKRINLTPAQRELERLEDRSLGGDAPSRKRLTQAEKDLATLEEQALEEGMKLSLSEKLRRARREVQEATEDIALETEALEAGTAPSRRRENIYAEKMSDYYKVKDAQVAAIRQLKTFIDFTIARLAKELDAKRRREGHTGGTVTWHLPEARLKERGLKDPTTGKAAKHLSARKHYSAGSANEKFGAYSFTADLLNIQDALNFALTGIDSLGKSTKARTAGRSLTPQWDKKSGRKGRLEMPGQVQVSTRAQELHRYMGPVDQMMLNFAWRSQAALTGNWEALANIRRGLTTEFNRGYSEESLDARLEAEQAAEAEGARAKAAIPRPDDEIGRGKSAEDIDRKATIIADRLATRALQDAYALEQREGRASNMPFDEWVKQQLADKIAQREKDFPLKRTAKTEGNVIRGPGGSFVRRIEGHDEAGLPLDRRRSYTEDDVDPNTGAPTPEALARMERDQQMNNAHSALFDPAGVEHPLVSKPESTTQALDRVKQMIRDGIAGDLPQRYINDAFLDQLARITTNTQVVHAPYDAVSGPEQGLRNAQWGWYSPNHDRVALSHDIAPDLYARTVLHETTHAALDQRLVDDPVFAKEVAALLQEGREHAARQGGKPGQRNWYGLTDPHEYLTESVSNKQFRDFMEGAGTPKSLLRRLWDAIRNTFARVVGFFHANTALDIMYYDTSSVLGKTDLLIARTMQQIENEGRKYAMPVNAEQVARQADGRYRRGAGVSAFISDAYGETQAWGKDVAKRAGYAWETRSKSRARGLDWMAQYDWTKLGPPEFREQSSSAFETIEKIFAEGNKLRDQDKRELGKAAKIFYGWSKGNRQRAAEGMIDESMHGYWADRYLSDKGNEHFRGDLSDTQAQEEHGAHMREYRTLAKELHGYKDFRNIIHKFSEKREEAMRRERIKDLVKHGNLIDANLPPDLRERLSTAVRNWIDTDARRLPGPEMHPLMGAPAEVTQRYENLKEVLERVPEKDLIKAHLDINDPDVIEKVANIRKVPDMQRLPGPYVPFTRQGRVVITGNFNIPAPPNAIVLEGDINHATGEPIGNDRFVFKTEAEARAFERKVTRDFGIKQLDGGKIDIDIGTGRRAELPDPKDIDDPVKFRLARGKALEKLKEAGAAIEERFFVQFQKKILYAFDNEYDAKKASDSLKDQYRDRITVTQPMDIYVRDGRQNEQFVGTELQRQIDHLRQSEVFKRLDEHEQAAIIDNLKQAAAQYVMKRGIKQRYLPRGFVKGPSTNILGSMDEYSAYSGRYLSKLQHQAELDERMGAMKTYLKREKDRKDVLAEQRVYNAMSHRLNSPTENPRDNAFNRWTDRALKYTMLDKLPGVGYFMANATDTIATGAPLMMGRHSPFRVVGYMTRMYALSRKLRAFRNGGRDVMEAIRSGVDMTDWEKEIVGAVQSQVDGTRLNDLYSRAFGRGVFDRSANLEYQNTYAMNKSKIDSVADWATGIFQGVNTAIENVNRFVTLGTAYRLEFSRLHKKGDAQAHEKAIKYAMDIAHEANGIYANFNTPEYFNKGPIAKLIFQFKKYPHRIMMNYIRAAMGTIRGVGQWAHGEKMSEENKERARQLAAMLITQGLLAGALGMPTEIFSIPITIFYQLGLIRYDWDDVQSGFRQWAGREFGKEGGGIVSHGVLRWMTGTAIDQRLAQNSLLTFGSPASRKEQDVKIGVLNFLMGATGSSAFQAFTGLQKAGDGMTALFDGAHDVAMKRFGEASRDLIPMRFITDGLTAASRMYPSGVESFRGQQMGKPLTGAEALVRGITGLQTRREAEEYEQRRDIVTARQTYTSERKRLSDEFAMSPPGMQRQDVAARVRRFNEENPDMPPLTMSDLLKAAGTRAKAEKLPASMVGLPDDKYTKALRKRGEVYLTD